MRFVSPEVVHTAEGQGCVIHIEVDHSVHSDGDRVSGQNLNKHFILRMLILIFLSDLLRRHIKGHCPHVHRGEAVNAGHYEEKARTLRRKKCPISI